MLTNEQYMLDCAGLRLGMIIPPLQKQIAQSKEVDFFSPIYPLSNLVPSLSKCLCPLSGPSATIMTKATKERLLESAATDPCGSYLQEVTITDIIKNLADYYHNPELESKLLTLTHHLFSTAQTQSYYAKIEEIACVVNHLRPHTTMPYLRGCPALYASIKNLVTSHILVEFSLENKIEVFFLQKLKEIGSGVTGIVYHVVDLSSGINYALKIKNPKSPVPKGIEREANTYHFLSEKIGKRLLIGVPSRAKKLESLSEEVALLMKLSPFDYFSYILSEGYKQKTISSKIFDFLQVLAGELHLIQLGIIHTDLKPDNLLCYPLDSAPGNYRIKIIDIDSVHFSGNYQNTVFFSHIYTPRYDLPFIPFQGIEFEEKRKEGLKKLLVFHLGCLLYAMLHQTYPFSKTDDPNSSLNPIDSQLPHNLRSFLWNMLQPYPEHRPSIEESYSFFYHYLQKFPDSFTLFQTLGEAPIIQAAAAANS